MSDLKFRIIAENLVKKGVDGAVRQVGRLRQATESVGKGFKGFASGIVSGFGKIGLAAMGVRATFGVVAGAAQKLWGAVKQSFKYETLTVQFSILFKSLQQARQHMEDLKAFSASTPFQIEGIAQASRQLHVFSDGVLGGTASLRLIGDAAAATGQEIDGVANWVGRAYSMIKAGRPFGEAAQRLQEMGILTAEARNEMEDLQASGGSASDIFDILRGELERFNGGMEETSKTGDGLVSTLKDNVNLTLAELGKQFQDVAKDKIAALIEYLGYLRDSGAIEEWVKTAKEWFEKLVPVFETVKTAVKGLMDDVGYAGTFWGSFFSKDKKDMSIVERLHAAGNEANVSWEQQKQDKKQEAEQKKEERTQKVRQAQQKREQQEAQDKEETDKKISEALGAADQEREKKRAEAEAQKERDKQQREAERVAKDEQRKQERIAQARQRLEERQERKAYEGMSSEDKRAYMTNKIANLQSQISGAGDEEQKIKLKEKLMDAQDEMARLEAGAGDTRVGGVRGRIRHTGVHKAMSPDEVLAGMSSRSARAEEIINRNLLGRAAGKAGETALAKSGLGQGGAGRTPEQDIAKNTSDTVEILKKIEKQGLGLAS